MKGFQTLLSACKAQLAHTDIKFKNVDYGFHQKTNAGLIAGAVIGGCCVGTIIVAIGRLISG
jgi:hypothetical protein